MRISDWSSDVCSADLRITDVPPRILQPFEVAGLEPPASGDRGRPGCRSNVPGALLVAHFPDRPRCGSDPGEAGRLHLFGEAGVLREKAVAGVNGVSTDRKSTRLNSSH